MQYLSDSLKGRIVVPDSGRIVEAGKSNPS
jgi:hypothetical protein